MAAHNAAAMADVAAERRGLGGRGRRRLLIGAGAALAAGLVAANWVTCRALAADAFQSVTDSYLIMWIERAGTALGCF